MFRQKRLSGSRVMTIQSLDLFIYLDTIFDGFLVVLAPGTWTAGFVSKFGPDDADVHGKRPDLIRSDQIRSDLIRSAQI